MSDYAVGGARRLNMGQVIAQTFNVIGRNAVSILVVCFAMTLASTVLGAAVHYALLGSVTAQVQSILQSLVSGIIGLFTHAVVLGSITAIVVNDLNGRPAPFSWALSVGFRLALPVMLLDFLVLLGMFAGILLLVVPGILLLLWWMVAVPVRVIEGLPIGAAMSRSRALTKGSRWAIFGLLVCYAVLALAFQGGFILADGGYTQYVIRVSTYDPFTVVVMVISGTILSAISTSGVAAIYTELRRTREGVVPGQLAAVFD